MQRTVNGVTIAYTDEGEGPPLVFVHGFPLSRDCWRPQIDAFRLSHRCIAPDLRGFGESEATAGPVPMDTYADDLARLLEALGTGPAVLIGHSMGGYVTFAFARRHPEMLDGLVLVGTRAGRDTPEAAAGRKATAETVQAHGVADVIDSMAAKMLAPDNRDERMMQKVRGFMESASPAGVAGALLGMAERPDSTPYLDAVTVPTLVITGLDDVIIPPGESQDIAAAITGSELQAIQDAGHLVAFEQADDFNQVLREWLAGAQLVSP